MAEQGECTVCPDEMLRCVHWNGRLLVLSSDDEQETLHTCKGGWRAFTGEGFAVHCTEDRYITCERTPDCPALVMPYPCTVCLEFDNLAEAKTEFHRQEAILIAS